MFLKFIRLVLIFFSVVEIVDGKCSFSVTKDMMPFKYDGDSFPINFTMSTCKEYLEGDVCCNQYNVLQTLNNFESIDGVFASKSGGCDICSINLKRFWCQFICSPKQAQFVSVSKDFYEYPDPENPGHNIMAQEVNITVQASTACTLYNSCKRLPFVSSVSAMSSPAGFLNFQGHNALDNAHQYMNVVFSYDKNKSLYFGNDSKEEKYEELSPCNFKGDTLHGFEMTQNCSCNTCQESCDNSQGFKYTDPNPLQGFNISLLVGTYGGVILAAGVLTYFRHWRQKKKERELLLEKEV